MSAASPDPQPPEAALDGGAIADPTPPDYPRAEIGAADGVAAVESSTVLPSIADPLAAAAPAGPASAGSVSPRKGPISILSGALTSGLLAWLCLGLSQKVLGYYALHPPHYEARVAQSIATALKTMIVGMTFLATFSFAFVGLGLFLVFLRSLLPARPETPA
jgi:hypothetical protein